MIRYTPAAARWAAFVAYFLFAGFSALSQELQYSICNGCWDPDQLGNHRIVIQAPAGSSSAHVFVPWRRRDLQPETKQIILTDRNGKRILNAVAKNSTRESCDLFFEVQPGEDTYYLYYLPYRNEGRSNYPKGVYLKPDTTASEIWLRQLYQPTAFKEGKVIRVESIDELNSFYPMEVIATTEETRQIITRAAGKAFVVFPELREFPIRMTDDLPQRWTRASPAPTLQSSCNPGEWFAFQFGIFALKDLAQVEVSFSDLIDQNGTRIPASAMQCINTDGIRYDGTSFKQRVSVAKGKVQALWCLLDAPRTNGLFRGTATIRANGEQVSVPISIDINGEVLPDKGAGNPKLQGRLAWLNSTLAMENTVVAPYTPMEVSGNRISILGRELLLANDGLPAGIQTYFHSGMTYMQAKAIPVLQSAARFVVSVNGKPVSFNNGKIQFTRQEPGTVEWFVANTSIPFNTEVRGHMEFDGFVSYTVKVTANQDITTDDVWLDLPFTAHASRYLMGLGQKGGLLPPSLDWKWEVATKNQDGAWIGNTNAGLQFSLRDEKYSRPLNTNFYLQKPLLLPDSWGNEGKGGIRISHEASGTLMHAYSGPASWKAGQSRYFNLTLLITPFHLLDTDFQWRTRFYHKYTSPDTVKKTGATVVNIHHANEINPWINYPFIEHAKMKAYVDKAHQLGLKVKIYNTVRELSNHAWETYALRSLGQEIYSPGKGGGYAWLQEHIGENYIAAWFVPELKDAAIVNSGMSRWHNYYVEGMNWLVQNVGIDGIYLDDVAFDRLTMKRIKRVLTAGDHPGIIDLHSANQYNKNDGFNNSANLYMEHFPYLNRLWFGEYFDYGKGSPEFYLTEVSGIPFGLMGEMLEGGGNPWRGMIYGMTSRMPWSKEADPRPVWNVWDQFGMNGTRMVGYWSEDAAVQTSNPSILATTYIGKGKALIAIASWETEAKTIHITPDWRKLGLNPSRTTLSVPTITNFQQATDIQFNTQGFDITVQPGKGWIILLREK